MDKKYIELFKSLAQTTAALAETVMEYNHEQGNEEGFEAAKTMRDNFQDLVGKITPEKFVLTKADAAHLLIASMIQTNQLQNQINNLKSAITGYQTDVIPKLQEIVDAASDEEAMKMADEKFVVVKE